MSASTKEERDSWVACLNSSISRSPFYELLAQRKRVATNNSSTSNLQSGVHR
jgi:hypothetical protein